MRVRVRGEGLDLPRASSLVDRERGAEMRPVGSKCSEGLSAQTCVHKPSRKCRCIETPKPPRPKHRGLRQMAAELRIHAMGKPSRYSHANSGTKHRRGRVATRWTRRGTGPLQERHIINMLSVARMRLQDLAEDEGIDGYSQHATREDLETALGDLRRGELMFQHVTQKQWRRQVHQGHHGVAQTQAAVQTAIAAPG